MSKPFVGVVIATDTESDVVVEKLLEHYPSAAAVGADTQLIELPSVYLVIKKTGGMGNIASSLGTRELIGCYRPICIVAAGIAAGTDPERQKYCDIVVGTDVVYYEPNKAGARGDQWRPQQYRSTIQPSVLSRLTLPQCDEFARHVPRKKAAPTPCIHRGMYASGEILVARAAVRKKLCGRIQAEYHQAPEAIEMEGAGIAAACRDFDTKFVLMKAISDFGEHKTDDWQKCAAAVSFLSVVKWAGGLTESDIDMLLQPPPNLLLKSDPLARAERVARLAGRRLPPRGVSPLGVREMRPDDLQTEQYDVANEKFIKAVLPNESEDFFGEETEPVDQRRACRWIVDPVDGTQNLVAGRPEVAVSIARYEGEDPKVAAIHLPYRDLTISATDFSPGLKANGVPWKPGRKVPNSIDDAVVALPGDFRRLRHQSRALPHEVVQRIISRVASIRITGALAYDLACLAMGEIDARLSTSAKVVDVAAGVLLIRAIGGKVTTLEGKEWTPWEKKEPTTFLAARSPALHEELLKLIRGSASEDTRP